jgi:hypothetical protein
VVDRYSSREKTIRLGINRGGQLLDADMIRAMRYRLRTLMLVTAVVPPATAFVWFHWRLLLIALVCGALLSIWLWVSYAIARFFGNLVASMMG